MQYSLNKYLENDACQLNEGDMNLNDLNANTTDDSTL